MTNTTIEAYLLASSPSELNGLPLTRASVDCTSDSIEAQMEALVELLADAQLTYDDTPADPDAAQLDNCETNA